MTAATQLTNWLGVGVHLFLMHNNVHTHTLFHRTHVGYLCVTAIVQTSKCSVQLRFHDFDRCLLATKFEKPCARNKHFSKDLHDHIPAHVIKVPKQDDNSISLQNK